MVSKWMMALNRPSNGNSSTRSLRSLQPAFKLPSSNAPALPRTLHKFFRVGA
jgi:hypothetical protein